MIRPGLCSVTFRAEPADQVVRLAVDAGLEGIEWGADVHLPPGDLGLADRLRRRCEDAGLVCPSYGSYLFVGRAARGEEQPVLETAAALGASQVRVWVPREGAAEDLGALVDAAAAHGVGISTEFHPGTRTETAAGALELLDAVERLATYWQPVPGAGVDASLAEWRVVAHRSTNLHVFWWEAGGKRQPLAEGAALWPVVLAEAGADGSERWAHLEFVPDDDPAVLGREATMLRGWLAAE